MPNLLQINTTANWGSTGKISEHIGIKVQECGWESYVAYSRFANPSHSILLKIASKITLYCHVLLTRVFDAAGLGSFCSTLIFLYKIRKVKPDIIHLHNIHGYVINYPLLFRYINKTNIKVVWTFHDCWAFTGHCPHFVTADCYRWKTGCHDCPLKREYPSSVIFDRSKANYAIKKRIFSSCNNLTIVPVSDWMAGFVKESFLRNKHIEVIHNGVDINVFRPIDDTNINKQFTVLAVSNVWNRDKGLYDIFRLRELLPDSYRILLVGVTPEQQKNLPSGIDSIQRTQNVEDLVQLYSSSDVLINPTYADTFPTVNLEALACGTPVITYKTGGAPEAIDGNTGIVVEQGDVEGLASAIKHIKVFPISSEECRRRAEDYFDKDKCFQKYIDLYDRLLNEK